MKTSVRQGFVMILMLASLAVMVLLGWAIVDVGCGEYFQSAIRNDAARAYYAALSGTEKMYAYLWYLDRNNYALDLSHTISLPITVGSQTYTIVARVYDTIKAQTGDPDRACIVASATGSDPASRVAQVSITYGYGYSYKNGIPLGCAGNMTLRGHGAMWLGHLFTSWVSAEGPIGAGGTYDGETADYVSVTPAGSASGGQSYERFPYWLGHPLDTDNSSSGADQWAGVDTNSDGVITRAEAITAERETEFNDDNKYATGDSVDQIDEKDAFYWYYTGYYTQPANNPTGTDLGLAPGGANHLVGNKSYDAVGGTKLDQSKKIVFVDGDVGMAYNAQQWWGTKKVKILFWWVDVPDDSLYSQDLTVVSMGTIAVAQPTNGANDRLTLISYGDQATAGFNLSAIAGIPIIGSFVDYDANLNIYTRGNFYAALGGVSYGSIFAGGDLTMDTWLPDLDILNMLNRDLHRGGYKGDWSNPANWPLGLPPRHPAIIQGFYLKTATEVKPRLERH